MFSKLLRRAARLAFDNRAAASIEYGLIACLIGLGSLAALTTMADGLIGIMSGVEGQVVESISSSDDEETAVGGLNLGNFNKAKNNKGRGKEKSQGKKKDKKPKS